MCLSKQRSHALPALSLYQRSGPPALDYSVFQFPLLGTLLRGQPPGHLRVLISVPRSNKDNLTLRSIQEAAQSTLAHFPASVATSRPSVCFEVYDTSSPLAASTQIPARFQLPDVNFICGLRFSQVPVLGLLVSALYSHMTIIFFDSVFLTLKNTKY